MHPKRGRGLIPKPGHNPPVEGLSLPVPARIGLLLLGMVESRAPWHGVLLGRGGGPRGGGVAEGGDGYATSTGRGAGSQSLKVYISELLGIWPQPV